MGQGANSGTHHEQIASYHAGSADFRESAQDVVQGGGGKGVDLLGRVLRQRLLSQLGRQGGCEGREEGAASGRRPGPAAL